MTVRGLFLHARYPAASGLLIKNMSRAGSLGH